MIMKIVKSWIGESFFLNGVSECLVLYLTIFHSYEYCVLKQYT